jgi:hypothetical protein
MNYEERFAKTKKYATELDAINDPELEKPQALYEKICDKIIEKTPTAYLLKSKRAVRVVGKKEKTMILDAVPDFREWASRYLPEIQGILTEMHPGYKAEFKEVENAIN